MALAVKNPPAKAGDVRHMGLTSGSGRPLEWGTATHSSVLAWRIHEQRSLVSYDPWSCKESDMTEATKHAHTQS